MRMVTWIYGRMGVESRGPGSSQLMESDKINLHHCPSEKNLTLKNIEGKKNSCHHSQDQRNHHHCWWRECGTNKY